MDDLASHPSFLFLDAQVEKGAISRVQAESCKSRFAELFKLTAVSVEREKDALAAARDLRTQVREEQISLERARIHKEQVEALSETADAGRRKLAHSLNEMESRETGLQIELGELRSVESDLQAEVAKLVLDNEALVTPALAATDREIADLRAEVSRATSTGESLARTKAELQERVLVLQAQTGVARSTLDALKLELTKVRADPARTERAVASVQGALTEATKEVAELRDAINARAAEMVEQAAALREVEKSRAELARKLSVYRADIDARSVEVQGVERSLRAEKSAHKDLLERRVELQTESAAAEAAVRHAETERSAMASAYDRARREFKRQDDQHNELLAAKPAATSKVEEQRLRLSSLAAEGAAAERDVGALKREMDLQIAAFLREEGLERKHKVAIEELQVECAGLLRDKDRWHAEEILARKQLSALRAQRDIKSRELAKISNLRKAALETSKMKELTLVDLTKQLADVNTRLRQFATMYDVVKNERNNIANAIQAASQVIAEQRERIKILHNEVDILQNESHAKEKALAKERQAHAAAIAQRDVLRLDANKATLVYKEQQSAVEKQILSIDKLNTIINGLEKGMMELKTEYESAVESRNYAGIQLIDRNDELVILYEKSNLHETTLGEGERRLATVQEEIRGLRITVRELERSLHLARGRFPETPMWAERILELQKALVQSRQVTEKLCADLESPMTGDRWVALGGEDPPAPVLLSKVEDLEARVGVARGQLLEKDLVIEELSSLIAKLQASLAANRDVTPGTPGNSGSAAVPSAQLQLSDSQLAGGGVALARQVADVQSRIKEVTKQMMATVSELSMYQATAIKLGAETETAHRILQEAQSAASQGLAPSLAAQQKWVAKERALTQPVVRAIDTSFIDAPVSVAEARPNAYIPEGIGIPRPYGEFAPFKPQDPGANMRHFRPPEQKAIEL